MNIYTQLCGLVIILLLIYFFGRQPTLGLNSEKSFRHILYVVLLCIILDILSCITIVYDDYFPEIIVKLIAKLYLFSLCSVAFFALSYTVTGVYENLPAKYFRLKRLIYWTIFIIGDITIFYLPIEIVTGSSYLYTTGPSVMATYIFNLFFIFTVIFEAVYNRKKIKPARRKAILTWMGLWVASAFIQFFFPRILIMGFASCAGMLLIFFEMENPEAAISRKTGHFSSAVIREYLDYMYQNRKTFSILMISFNTIGDSSSDTVILRKTIESLSEFLFTVKEAKVFDTAEGYFILVFDGPDFIDSTKFKITHYFQTIEDSEDVAAAISLLNPYYTVVPDCNIATTPEELLTVLSNFIPSEHKSFETNEIVVNDMTIMNIRKRKEIEDMVLDSIENNRVEVFYQPIYNIKKDKFTSAEALVRIRTEDGRIVKPNDFIPIVEETGRIIPLSDAIYRRALSFMKTFRIERLGLEYIELNLSVRQGESPNFASKFKELLKEYSIEPTMVNLEITETSSLISKENILNNMSRLEKIGITFSLDDFGSGSSNLNYIIDMPVRYVKLDKDLTDAYMHNDKAKSIVNAVIEMAHSINIEIIAEGIETKEALEEMKTLGVDYIQGYYFSPPVPEREFLAFIQNNNLNFN